MPIICRNRILFPLFFAILLLSSIFGRTTPAAQTAKDPSAAEILADYKAASGGDTWDSATSITMHCEIKQGGLSGVDDNWQDTIAGKYADKFTIGGLSAGEGFNGTRAWSVDQAGIPRYLDGDGDVKSAATNCYMTSLSYWYPSRQPGTVVENSVVMDAGQTYWVLTAAPQHGFPIELWFNTDTKLLERTVETTSRGTTTTTFSDMRPVNGLLLPFSTVISSGDPKYAMITRVDSVSINEPIPPAVFEAPTPAPPDFTIAGGETSTTVPFRYTLNHIYVPVKINGNGPFDAILDTGAQFAIRPEFATKYDIAATGQLPAHGIGPDTVSESISKVSTLQIGDVTISNLTASVLPMPTPPDNPLIGAEIFRRFAVKIDFDKLLLTLTPLSSFTYEGAASPVRLQFYGEIPVVFGTLDGVSGPFMVDTGSGNSLDLFSGFIDKEELRSKYSSAFSAVSGYGVGGSQTASVARAKQFAVGSAVEQNMLVYLSNAKQGSYANQALAGNIGSGFLHRFNLTFDYGHKSLYLEANSHTADPDPYERLGVIFNGGPNGCTVTDVVLGSPADQAGITVGDIILSVNGTKVDGNDGAWFEDQLLQPVGTQLELKVLHGSGTLDVIVTLKDLI